MRVRRRRQRPWPNCNYGTGVPGTESPGWASYDNSIVDNTFNQNAAGVVVEGAFAPNFSGLTPTPTRRTGTTSREQWSGGSIVNFWPELWTSVVLVTHLPS